MKNRGRGKASSKYSRSQKESKLKRSMHIKLDNPFDSYSYGIFGGKNPRSLPMKIKGFYEENVYPLLDMTKSLFRRTTQKTHAISDILSI